MILLGGDTNGQELMIDETEEPSLLVMLSATQEGDIEASLELTAELADEIKIGLERWAHMQRMKGKR